MSLNMITVAITGFGGLNHADPGKSIADSIKSESNEEVKIIALVKNLRETSAWLCDSVTYIHQISESWQDSSHILDDILNISNEKKIDVIIPGTNEDAYWLSKIGDTLRRHGIKTYLPPVSGFELIRTDALLKLDFGEQIKIPKSVLVKSIDAFKDLSQIMNFPLSIRSDQIPVKVVYDATSVENYFNSSKNMSPELYVQEFVMGETYQVSGLINDDGNVLASVMIRGIAMRKDGTVGAGAVVEDPDIEECFKKIVDTLNWKGVLTVCLRLDPKKKQYTLVDLRAHLPAWGMATYWANKNLPHAYLNYILNATAGNDKKLKNSSIYIASISERAFSIDVMKQFQENSFYAGEKLNQSQDCNDQYERKDAANVAVTGLSSLDIVNPGLGVARALCISKGVNNLTGFAYDNFDSGIYQKPLFNKVIKLNYDAPVSDLLNHIRQLNETNSIDVLIPCLDGELENVIEIKSELENIGISTLLPTKEALERRSKSGLCKLGDEWDVFSVPTCLLVKDKKELRDACKTFGMPTIIKGPISGCMVAHSRHELEGYYKYFESIGEKEVILQKKVDGAHYAVSVVCDKNHNVVSSVTVKKFARCDRGSTWGAVNVSLPELEQSFAKLLRSIEWVGPAEGEFILDEFSNHFYLFEINPRFTGWVYFTSQIGENQPQIAVDLALGKQVSRPKDVDRMFFMRSMEETHVTSKDLALFTTQGQRSHA